MCYVYKQLHRSSRGNTAGIPVMIQMVMTVLLGN